MDVGAVCDRVGVAEAFAEALVQRHVGDFGAGDRVHHQQPLDQQRVFLGGVADAERIEHRQRVGRHLQADAGLAEFRRLLKHQRLEAVTRKRQRAGQPANPAARDGDRPDVTRSNRH